MGPVLLLDVRPVVLVARPGPGEGDLVGGAVVEKVGVDELRTVIAVDSKDREGELATTEVDRLGDCLLYTSFLTSHRVAS